MSAEHKPYFAAFLSELPALAALALFIGTIALWAGLFSHAF